MKKLIITISAILFGRTALADPISDPDFSSSPGIDLSIQSVFGIVQGLACWMSRFALVLMVGFIVWYGIQFLTSRGDPGRFGKAKTSLGYAVIGIVVIFATYTIIATVGYGVQSIGGGDGSGWINYTPLGNCSQYF